MDSRRLTQRMIRAAKLEVHLYEEVEHDPTAAPQAAAVVVLSSIAGGIGLGSGGVGALVMGSIVTLLAWLLWGLLTYWIGMRLFRGPETSATYGELLRTIGFSASPGLIRIAGLFEPLQGPVFLIASVWSLIAMVIAVRQALDFTTARAIGTCLVGWLTQAILLGFLLAVVG